MFINDSNIKNAEIVNKIGKREITHVFHDIDGTHSLIRQWHPVMSVTLEYTILENPSVVIVPLVACDKNLNRIGMGKGYYDRYLRDKTAIKIGICYDFQVVDKIIPNKTDIPLDIIVTENQILGETLWKF